MSRMQELKNKLTQLASMDKDYEIFGSKRNPYQFNPCLTLLEVQAFEAKYNTTLPEDYRSFLMEVGNGGPGPGCGLLKIDYDREMAQTIVEETEDFQPIPHNRAWHNLGVAEDAFSDEDLGQYVIVICHYGCAIYAHLAITGEQRGKIWIDDGDNGNYVPASLRFCKCFHSEEDDETEDDSQALSFYDWYEDWLDRSLEMMSRI